MTARATAPSTRDVLKALRQPRVLVTLLLGFSSGLPFMLTGNTLGFWLRELGTELAAIGFLSWVGLAYSGKWIWAPIIDRIDAPLLGRWLGRRRGWMLLAQLIAGVGLIGMALAAPSAATTALNTATTATATAATAATGSPAGLTGGISGDLTALAICAVIVAFASATQDIVVDAWRIERAEGPDDLALLSAAFQLGYRVALLATDALILLVAASIGWAPSYIAFGAAMAIGLFATLKATEPARMHPDLDRAFHAAPPLYTLRGLYDAILGPFLQFFRAHGLGAALLMLAAVSLYRLPDFVMGPMANPFYVDLGLSKETVGTVRASVGFAATAIGITGAAVSSVRLGFERTLIIGAIMVPASNLAFSAMALAGPDIGVFSAAMAIDNISQGFGGAALVAYMSSLTGLGYTATQYALLSSFYAMLGKVLKGFSGAFVELLQQHTSEMTAYAIFFACTAAIGVPAVVLCGLLAARSRRARVAFTPPES